MKSKHLFLLLGVLAMAGCATSTGCVIPGTVRTPWGCDVMMPWAKDTTPTSAAHPATGSVEREPPPPSTKP